MVSGEAGENAKVGFRSAPLYVVVADSGASAVERGGDSAGGFIQNRSGLAGRLLCRSRAGQAIAHGFVDGSDIAPVAGADLFIGIDQAAGIDFGPDVHVRVGEMGGDDFG